MNKRIIYRPKTMEQAKAAYALAVHTGHVKKREHKEPCAAWPEAVRSGMEFRDGDALSNPGAFLWSADYTTIEVSTLDELLAALTEKPEKEPKEIGPVHINIYHGVGLLKATEIHRAVLQPDGKVRVGCHEIHRDDFEQIAKAHAEYMKE